MTDEEAEAFPLRQMTALLETCTLVWAAREPERLPARVRDLLLDPGEELIISVVSAWEISLKPTLAACPPRAHCHA